MQTSTDTGHSYFDSSGCASRAAEDSAPVSPSNSTRSPGHPPTRRPVLPRRLGYSQSDFVVSPPRIRVQTILEDVAAKACSTPALRGIRDRSDPNNETSEGDPSSRASLTVSDRSSSRSSTFRGPRNLWTRESGSGLDEAVKPAAPPGRPRPGHRWSRTRSGEVWYEKLGTSSAGRTSDASSASYDTIPIIPQSLLVPLTPPKTSMATVETAYHHKVKVETSFTNLRPVAIASASTEIDHTGSPVDSSSRRNSLIVRHVLSAPLQLARKISRHRPKSRTHNPIISELSNFGKSRRKDHRMEDHSTLLKRNHTLEALRRVTSILLEAKPKPESRSPTSGINPVSIGSLSNTSSSSRGSHSGEGPQMEVIKGIVSPVAMWNRTSVQDLLETASYTSSQRQLMMGTQPPNSPEALATYKIKRSPSADTEEFLKVDVSIRGETSYLPSEARRIHTPPLPQERPDGKRRGFFFDYNAPEVPRGPKNLADAMAASLSGTFDQEKVPMRSTSRAVTIGAARHRAIGKSFKRARTGDWYDAKLAELESSDDEADHENHVNRARSTSAGSCFSEIRRQKEARNFDLSIPEHLPSSPLCPRHPKYWRVVQQRGSQFRGCWMHGVGVGK